MKTKQNSSTRASALQITNGVHGAAGEKRTARRSNPHSTMKTPVRFLLTLLCAAIASLQIVRAAPITVTSTADSGAGSLRQALADANDGDTIGFSVTGTIALSSDQLVVNKSVTISGPGANVLTVQRVAGTCSDSGSPCTPPDTSPCGSPGTAICNPTPNFRIFTINSGKTVTISGLTITNGSATGNGFPNNVGGGIYNDHSTLTVSNCTVTGNVADGRGGGIYNDGGSGSATLTVLSSTLDGNTTNGYGGGIYNDGLIGSATLTVLNSTLSGNSALVGGGIYNDGGEGSATLTINNSTLSGNSASSGVGGAIFNLGLHGSGAVLNIGSTILKAGGSGGTISNSDGTVNSQGYNLSSDAAGGDGTTGPGGLLNATGDIRNTDPKLAPLGDNGGLTFTHALCTASGVPDASCTGASPAIDQGKNFSGSTTDQRGTGFARTVDFASIPNATGGDGTDIGAFEVQAPTVCPQQPQGYWKNNPAAWPASALPMTLGSQSYTQAQLLTILRTPIGTGPKADASLILADQLIAAKLNIAIGADGTPVTTTIADADIVLSLYSGKLPYRVRPNSTNGQRMVTDAATLESFNKGMLTPGCGG
jgi:hypothetical protein